MIGLVGTIKTIRAAARPVASVCERRAGIVACRRLLAVLEAVDDATVRTELRNGGLVYRSVGDRGEPYPDWLRHFKGESGVYIIRDRASGDVLYVGESHSARLYETLTRHFQEWRRWKGFWRGQYGEGHDPGLTYERSTVEVAVRATSADEAINEELRLIRRLHPRDNLVGQPDEAATPF